MKIYYDREKMTVLADNTNRYFGNNSLIATNVGNLVIIKYQDTDTNEIALDFTKIEKEDGSPAGTNVTEVVNYLNSEFSKGMQVESASFNGLTDEVTIINNNVNVKTDIFIFSPISISVNEILFIKEVQNGSFTVKRKIVDVLSTLTSNLIFKYIIF